MDAVFWSEFQKALHVIWNYFVAKNNYFAEIAPAKVKREAEKCEIAGLDRLALSVVKETADILETFGFMLEQRGLVSVKGKGMLMTFYLLDKKPPAQQLSALTTHVHTNPLAQQDDDAGVNTADTIALPQEAETATPSADVTTSSSQEGVSMVAEQTLQHQQHLPNGAGPTAAATAASPS
ncbi:hypothetical protein MRX96_039122 [Rhipicephalus microplus]|uniref:Uncharacterized protein n=1 Tax=Rhipicephalus microplus TaxID=6941 RepID=A0A9J6DUQ2_RHIMP|nr:hypothetical protein HPB51_011466 [Rhipicephalus microplus]